MADLLDAIQYKELEEVQRLLKEGANPNVRFPSGLPALHATAEAGETDILRALLDAGADVNIKDVNGQTVADATVRQWYRYSTKEKAKFMEIIRMLLRAGATLDPEGPMKKLPADWKAELETEITWEKRRPLILYRASLKRQGEVFGARRRKTRRNKRRTLRR